jgi:hypothetical protein
MDNKLTNVIDSHSPDHLYVLITWPWVQELMEYNWFRNECILYQAFDEQQHLDSAYFVPIVRLSEIESDTNESNTGD